MKKLKIAVALLVVLTIVRVWSATPQISDWSSSGGTTQNKDNEQDIMYLVQPGDVLTFGVTVDQPVSYEWVVNKSTEVGRVVTTPATSDAFNWTVPNEKCIWEIHLKVSNANGENHLEWVISTLSLSEAPEFFDYFSDLKYYNRTEKDPWGRSLPEWNETDQWGIVGSFHNDIYNISQGYAYRTGGNSNQNIYAPSNTVYGTWIFRYPDEGHLIFGSNISSYWLNRLYVYSHAKDGHAWFENYLKGRGNMGFMYINQYGAFISYVPNKWIELKIIHAPDGSFYVFYNNELFPDTPYTEISIDSVDYIYTGTAKIDNVEIYKNRYLFPDKNITYTQYESYYNGASSIMSDGIVIRGGNITLRDINVAINNPLLFIYDSGTRTGIAFTNLVIEGGAKLLLVNETLKIHSNYDGEREIRVKNGADIELNNTTITSDNVFYCNRLASSSVATPSPSMGEGWGGGDCV